MKKVLLTATVQSHICQFHKPLVQMLHRHGCEVHVAARDNLAEKNGLKLDFADKVYDIPFARSPKSADNIKAYRQLKAILQTEQYDVIHCNTPMGGIVTRLAAQNARKQGTQVFYTAHGFHFYNGAPKKNWLVFYPIEKQFAKITDKLITINREDRSLAQKKFQSQIHYIHGVGVDAERYQPASVGEKAALRKELGFSQERNILLCVGELLPNKNQIMAIRAVQMLRQDYPEVLLLVAGNGPEREHLENAVHEYGLQDHVIFLGYCTCLEKYQKAADLLVSCSQREGLPLNIVEAMLSGNPVVASKNRGHCELIEDGKTGFLVERNDHVSMADRIKLLLSNSTGLEDMGKRARAFALDYSVENVRQELENIYFCE